MEVYQVHLFRNLIITVAIISICGFTATAQTALDRPNLRVPTFISPYYFGPNAFPVPDMLDGTVSPDLEMGMYVDYFRGDRGDQTGDIAVKVAIPLFTDRVNLSFWMPCIEMYKNSEENIAACRLEGIEDKELRKGHFTGDAYVSCDIQVFKEKRVMPAITVRSVLKTASSTGYYYARYYDSPGYFFDFSVGKSFKFAKSGLLREIRGVFTAGFLCWQTDNGRQNDAILYGLQAILKGPKLELSCAWGGYNGWESGMRNNFGAHDRPQTLKLKATYHLRKFDLVAAYQKGLRDYPYQQFRIGASYHIDILQKLKKGNSQP